MAKIISISSQAEFTRLLSTSKVVVADFYADWCGPCKAIAPFYASLSTTHAKPSAVTFTKINTDEQRALTQAHSITAMPTFLVFKDRREVARVQGADAKGLEAAVKKAVADVTAFSTTGGRTLGDGGASGSASASAGAGAASTSGAGGGKTVYFRNGQAVTSRPFAVRARDFLDAAYVFFALYFISLLSFDPYAAAEESSFNQKRRPAGRRMGWGGFGRGSGGGGPGGPGGPPRKLGRVGGGEDKGRLFSKGCCG